MPAIGPRIHASGKEAMRLLSVTGTIVAAKLFAMDPSDRNTPDAGTGEVVPGAGIFNTTDYGYYRFTRLGADAESTG